MKTITINKEGLYNYEVLEKYEAGIVLTGPEVKSVKLGQISLRGAYIRLDKNNEAWLIGSHILPYKPAKNAQINYNPDQHRKLLLRRKELDSLLGKSKQKNLTIIPTSVYNKRGLIKIELALAKGKSKIDKRETIKKRESAREIKRVLRQK